MKQTNRTTGFMVLLMILNMVAAPITAHAAEWYSDLESSGIDRESSPQPSRSPVPGATAILDSALHQNITDVVAKSMPREMFQGGAFQLSRVESAPVDMAHGGAGSIGPAGGLAEFWQAMSTSASKAGD